MGFAENGSKEDRVVVAAKGPRGKWGTKVRERERERKRDGGRFLQCEKDGKGWRGSACICVYKIATVRWEGQDQ